MLLTDLHERVVALRDQSDKKAAVESLLPELERLASDDQVEWDTRINIITRAHRALFPTAARRDTPQRAVEDLRLALTATA